MWLIIDSVTYKSFDTAYSKESAARKLIKWQKQFARIHNKPDRPDLILVKYSVWKMWTSLSTNQ